VSAARTAIVLVIAASSVIAFAWVLRQLSFVSVELAAHREVEQQLRQTLEDQKKLARLDPASSPQYRKRFDEIARLSGHLRVVQINRAEVARQVERVLVGLVAVILGCGLALYFVERRSRERHVVRLEDEVERASRRLRYLENLSVWQEAARRHAHEIRTPLAAARMEVERLAPGAARESILEELDHLAEFTRNFTSFATIQKPRVRELDVRDLTRSFCETFATAWPGLELVPPESGPPARVAADGEMLRQVFANLASNSALSGAHTIAFLIRRDRDLVLVDVKDDGPGVSPEIAPRLFEPYTTTRGVGEGMGLGLAISRKILLDHGGDLDLISTDYRRPATDYRPGATFRLTFPALEAA
jgi:signal transduction histidine kinase